jgi:hypothetical protein
LDGLAFLFWDIFAEFYIAEQEIHTKLGRGDKRKVATGRKRRPQD